MSTASHARDYGPGSAMRRAISALEARGCKRKGKHWTCPCHDDSNASLSPTYFSDGRLNLNCFGGCDSDAVREALGLALADIYDDPPSAKGGARPNRKPGAGAAKADPPPEVELLDPPMLTAAQIERLVESRRITTAEKIERARLVRVRARFFDPERAAWRSWAEWIGFQTWAETWKLWKFDESGGLVRINVGSASLCISPDLRTRNGGGVERAWFLEGESDWLAAIDSGMTCLIAPTAGAGSLSPLELHRDRIRALELREIVVAFDRDGAGRKGAEQAAAWFLRLGISVRVLELPDELGDKGDLRDYLMGRTECDGRPALDPLGGPADLDALADATPLREARDGSSFDDPPEGPPDEESDARPPLTLEAVSFSGDRLLALLGREAPPPIEAARPVPGHFSTLVAPVMVGKTALALWNGMARAAGVAPWPGVEARPAGRVLFYSIDEAPEQVARRMRGLSILHPAGRLEEYAAHLVVAGPDRDVDPAALETLRFDEAGLAALERWLTEAEAAGEPFVELYVDAYADVLPLGESENDNGEATRIGGALERLAVRHGCAIVLLHHCGKPKPDAGEELPDVRYLGRGASALAAKARAVTSLELVGGMPHLRRIRTATNLGRTPKPELFEVCSPESTAGELIYFRPAADPNARDPRELLSPGETITTGELARRLAGDSLAEGAEPPGDLKRLAASLRETWRQAGKVIVEDGPRRSKTLSLVEEKAA